MAAHAKAKQRVHTHKGVDFIVVPGSRREQVLLDLFQSEDRLANRAPIIEADDDNERFWIPVLIGGVLVGFSAGILAGWLI